MVVFKTVLRGLWTFGFVGLKLIFWVLFVELGGLLTPFSFQAVFSHVSLRGDPSRFFWFLFLELGVGLQTPSVTRLFFSCLASSRPYLFLPLGDSICFCLPRRADVTSSSLALPKSRAQDPSVLPSSSPSASLHPSRA